MTTSAPNRQGLKPFSFQTLYGTVETVPYKDFLVATQALQPVGVGTSKAETPQAEACATTIGGSFLSAQRPRLFLGGVLA